MRPAGDFVVGLVGRGADAETAVALAGGRIGERLAWSNRPDRRETLSQAGILPWVESLGAADVLAIEAEGVDGDTLAAMLPAIVAEATARDIALVVAFGREQIDQVAAVMLGGTAVLLCEPDIAERVAAYAVAGRHAGSPTDTSGWVREGEAERLRQLNAEIARIATLLAGLVDPPAPGDGVGDRRTVFASEPVDEAPVTAAEIRRVIRARRLREQFFDARLLEDPGWDMLLDLFAAELEDAQVSVSSLCIASGVAPTTALRWISRMADAALLVRVPDAGDRRRAFLVLSADASRAMRAYVAAVRRAGLPIV